MRASGGAQADRAKPTRTAIARVAALSYAVILGATLGGCRLERAGYFDRIAIDTATLRVTMDGYLGAFNAVAGWQFYRFRDARFRIHLDEFAADSAAHPFECREFLSLDSASHLEYRSRVQSLWRGDFGDIIAQTTYFYAARYDAGGTSFVVRPEPATRCVEHPRALAVAPDPAALRVDGVSVVRVEATGAEFRIVSANYDASGALYSASSGTVPASTAKQRDPKLALQVMTSLGERVDSIARAAGLPVRLRGDTASLDALWPARRDTSGLRVLLSVHYDHNHVVRQESRDEQGRVVVRWLGFARTTADSLLARRDDARRFSH